MLQTKYATFEHTQFVLEQAIDFHRFETFNDFSTLLGQ